jgi:hypothetical protein
LPSVPPPKKDKGKEKLDEDDMEIIELPALEEEEEEELDLEEEEEEGEEGEDQEDSKKIELEKDQIKLYYNNLPWLDKELPFDEQGHLSTSEWLAKITVLINDRTSTELVKLGFYTTAGLAEQVGSNLLDLKLKGYERALRENPEIEELLTIIKIKHLSSLQDITPEYRLLGICLLTAVSCHRLNSIYPNVEDKSPPYKE